MNPSESNPLYPASAPPFVPRQAKLNSGCRFGIFRFLGEGWNLMANQFWPFVGFYLLAYVLFSAVSSFVIPVFFLAYPIFGGYFYFCVKESRGQRGSIDDLFDGFKRKFGSLAMLSFIVTSPVLLFFVPAMVFLGWMVLAATDSSEPTPPPSLALAVSGLLLLIGLIFLILQFITTLATMLCLDCDIGWGPAMRLANRCFWRHPFRATLFSFLFNFLNLIGVLVFFVGSFVTGAWTAAAYARLYESAFGDEASPA